MMSLDTLSGLDADSQPCRESPLPPLRCKVPLSHFSLVIKTGAAGGLTGFPLPGNQTQDVVEHSARTGERDGGRNWTQETGFVLLASS